MSTQILSKEALAKEREEEWKGRVRRFNSIRPCTLFYLPTRYYYIAVKKLNDVEWEVIYLSKENRQKIIAGEPCETICLHIKNMYGLNLSCDWGF